MSAQRPPRQTVLWTIQGLLALLFLFAGSAKLLPGAEQMAEQSPLPVGFLRFIGVCEVLGGLGLVVPGLTGIRPGLTKWAAAGLVIIMVGAVVTTTLEMGAVPALFPLSVGLLTAYVGYRRASPAPAAVAAVTLVAALLGPTAAAAQTVPRTPWGHPDLQGLWVGSTLTPLERPERFGDRAFLTDEEVAELEHAAVARNEALLERPAERTTAGGSVDWRADGSPGFYNNFWLDNGTAWAPDRRTSLIVDPPDGRIPYTADAQDGYRPHGSGPWHSHLDLDTGERCLGDGLPQIWFGYNPNHQILQTPTHVVIVHEMFRERRIIPLDGRPALDIPQWNGEPRGRWEGDTLVVESSNFPSRPKDRWVNTWRRPSPTLHLVERFARVDEKTIAYEATITDPWQFTSPWTLRFDLSADQSGRGVAAGELFEFACHEGNYAIMNVLRGARASEK